MLAEGVEGTFEGDDARSSDSSGLTRRYLHCRFLPRQLGTTTPGTGFVGTEFQMLMHVVLSSEVTPEHGHHFKAAIACPFKLFHFSVASSLLTATPCQGGIHLAPHETSHHC